MADSSDQNLLQQLLQGDASPTVASPSTSFDPAILNQLFQATLTGTSSASTSPTLLFPNLLQSFLLSQLSSPSTTDSSSTSVLSSPNTISSVDSGISSPVNILKDLDSLVKKATTPLGRGRQRIRREWCSVCNASIVKNGCRSQGPRRHIMQHHLMKPMFLCPAANCDFSSNYDKAHVHAHIRRMHPGMQEEARSVDKGVYQTEEDLWMERCFGVTRGNREVGEEKENNPSSPVKKEEDGESEESKQHPFSINTLLTPPSQPAQLPVLPIFAPVTSQQRSILAILDQAMKKEEDDSSS